MKRAGLWVVMAAALIAATVYNVKSQRPASTPPAAGSAAHSGQGGVQTVTLKSTQWVETLRLPGVVGTTDEASVTAAIPGKVLAVMIREGEVVSTRQPLITLDTSSLKDELAVSEAGLQAAQAQVDKAKAGMEARREEMRQAVATALVGLQQAKEKRKQAVTGTQLSQETALLDLEKARAGVRQAQAGVDQAQQAFNDANEAAARLDRLFQKGGIPLVDVNAAKSQAKSLEGQLASAKEALAQAQAGEKSAAAAAHAKPALDSSDLVLAQSAEGQAQEGLRSARATQIIVNEAARRDLEAARAQLRQAAAGRDVISHRIADGVVRAGSSGRLGTVTVKVGDFIQPGQPLVTITGARTLYAEVRLPISVVNSSDSNRLVGMVELTSGSKRSIRSRINVVHSGQVGDGRSLPARLTLPVGSAVPGESLVVTATVQRSGLTAPATAVQSVDGKSIVWISAQGKAEQREVTVTPGKGDQVILQGDIRQGNSILAVPPAEIKPGDPIAPSGEER